MNFLSDVMRIAFLGPGGSYTEIAKDEFKDKYDIYPIEEPLNMISKVIDFVDDNPQTVGVIPIENSIEGTVRESSDCLIKTKLRTLIKLRDRHKMSALINRGDITIDGDMQVVQNWSALLDMAQWEPAQYLAPYIGDLAAQSLTVVAGKGVQLFSSLLSQQKGYLRDALI